MQRRTFKLPAGIRITIEQSPSYRHAALMAFWRSEDANRRISSRPDRQLLYRAVDEVAQESTHRTSWYQRVAAVHRRLAELSGRDGAFPWRDALVVDAWLARHGH